MKLFQKKNPQKIENPEKIENNDTTLPLSLEDAVEVVFLLIPYLKVFKSIKLEYKSDSPLDLYKDVTQNLLSQLDKDDLSKILGIIFDAKGIKHEYRISDLLEVLPRFIRQNHLYEVYLLLKQLGVFD